jgi:enoyl-CoA hydratase/carnithine racemase
MADRVTCTIHGGVADVRLNRPDKLNALDLDMFDALVETGERLRDDRSVRAAVLSGEGRGFCAGLDVAMFSVLADAAGDDGTGGDPGRRGRELGRRDGRITNHGQQAVFVWTEMPAPVIAAVHGVALGGGFQLAIGADMRFVAPDARLSVLEIRWGLVPDMTGTQMLPRLVGLDVAKELTFTGRMVSGEEAGRLGLATRVTDTPYDDAMALAAEIAAKSPHAVRGAKRLLNLAGQVSLADGFAAEYETISGLIGSPNQRESIAAYLAQRPPVYED